MESLSGKLLLANGNLWDPNFRRTVVLVGHHDGDGAVGVVLNRVSGVSVGEAVPTLAPVVGPEDPVYVGGPVQPDAAVLLAEFSDTSKAGMLAFRSVGFLLGDVEQQDLEGVRRIRVFAGYSGWGPGQLEDEIAEDSWIIEPALPEDVFTDDPENLWSNVLKRKGKQFEILSTMPVDPSLN